ncbi:Transcription factor MYB98 [Striga hermonthica]|uniref:Transcription factor MYB98 n=1 Tax=Striga hermonthica TaxID=68872 RepID=A0A9N7RMC1_STRHE|nr:Transcription factor MYB98 [Striga hermonthica]
MESRTKYANDDNDPAPAICFPNISLKSEILDDDFHIDNLSTPTDFLHDYHNLDQYPLVASYVNQDFGIHEDCFYPVDPFPSGSFVDFDLCEHDSIRSSMQDLEVGGCFNFSDKKDSLMDIETALTYHDTKPFNFVVPDESSCLTADNLGFPKQGGSKRSNKNVIQCRKSKVTELPSAKTCIRGQKFRSAKGQWTVDEDRLLTHLVGKYGERKWSTIAQMLKGRIGKQCRERWHNHLRPDIKKDLWTEDEDRILIEIHAQVGNKWAEIAKSLPGRTENSIKNHWNATKRRQFSRRSCRTKWPKPSSLLQNYIKSLNFEKKSSSLSKITRTPKTVDPEILNNSTSVGKKSEMEFQPNDQTVSEYGFADVSEFTFNDYHLFRDNNMESLMEDIRIGGPSEIDEHKCCDVVLPFDIPLLMECDVMKEIDSFDGNM